MKIIVSIDDGCNHDMRVAELLDKYNLSGIFYIPAYWESYATIKGWRPLTKEQVLQISERHEIGSHGITHALLTRVPTCVAEYEIIESKKILEYLIQKPITSFCYPRGYGSDPLREIVRKVYKTARNTLVGSLEEPEDPIWSPTTVHVCCNRKEYMGDDWLDYARKLLKIAKRRKDSVYHLWGHSAEIDHNDGWRSFETLLAEATS